MKQHEITSKKIGNLWMRLWAVGLGLWAERSESDFESGCGAKTVFGGRGNTACRVRLSLAELR